MRRRWGKHECGGGGSSQEEVVPLSLGLLPDRACGEKVGYDRAYSSPGSSF
jgi:hypothetical protein